jgi:hypothetical protein
VKKWQLFDLIRKVSELTKISSPVIVGSQSLFAITDQVPSIVDRSVEADFLLGQLGGTAMRQVNDELGVTSNFYDEHGYYADGLGLATVVLVPGWEERLLPLEDETGRIVARCLEVHDVAVSKLMAGREKDFTFISALLESRLISLPSLVERATLVEQTASEGALLPRLQKLHDHLRHQRASVDLAPLHDFISRLSQK